MRIIWAIAEKVSDEAGRYFENGSLKEIGAAAGKSALAVTTAFLLSYPSETSDTIIRYASAFNFFPVKFACSVFLWFVVLPRVLKRFKRENNGCLIEGIPVDELLDHVFTYGNFKRDDAENLFAMPRNRYKDLIDRMDALGIFVRGENNSRVLNPELSRQEVAALVKGERSYVTLSEIRERVAEFLSPPLSGGYSVEP